MTSGDIDNASKFAKELLSLQPEVILSSATPATVAIHRQTRTIPIVFVVVSDPIGSGLVQSFARPGGNVTGFVNQEASLAEKWLELLLEIAPNPGRVVVIFNPLTATYADYYLQPLKRAAAAFKAKLIPTAVSSDDEIERAIADLERERGDRLIVMTDSFMYVHRKTIIELTARYKVPAIHPSTSMVTEGGLISYSVDNADLFRRAADYVDRILKGTKPADLPVQFPTKFELAINLKTAKALGLTVPPTLLARADEVIE
jgi:putative tryptophan/tyrosine transport system substrate-binding protein